MARLRVETRWPGYGQPEDFGYEFKDWVSPYSKGAHALDGIAVILQDWSSADALRKTGFDPDVQQYGRTPGLLTNRRLEFLLQSVFGLSFPEVFVTNVFPFIKPGSISNGLPRRDVVRAATEFTRNELEIVQPSLTIALGRHAQRALEAADIPHAGLPHPAARIGGTEAQERIWREVLGGSVETSQNVLPRYR